MGRLTGNPPSPPDQGYDISPELAEAVESLLAAALRSCPPPDGLTDDARRRGQLSAAIQAVMAGAYKDGLDLYGVLAGYGLAVGSFLAEDPIGAGDAIWRYIRARADDARAVAKRLV